MADRNAFVATQTDTVKQSAAVSVGASSVTVAAANPQRVEVTITNDHATQLVYLCLGPTAEISKGIRLNAAGGSYTTSSYSGIITGIASGAATTTLVSEL